MNLREKIRRRIREAFEMDLRALSVFRICLALLILFDLAQRSLDLTKYYTDFGVLPRKAIFECWEDPYELSIHFMNGTPLFQSLLFGVQGFLALLLLVGYRTRWALFGLWFFLLSLYVRNPFVCSGADPLLRISVFWSLFLPLDAHSSLETLRRPKDPPPKTVCSLGSFAFIVFILSVYVSTGIFKSRWPEWWNGEAMRSSFDSFWASSAGKFLLNFPSLMKPLGRSVVSFEILAPVLILLTQNKTRAALLTGFLFMLAGFFIFLNLGIFPWVCMIVLIPLIPSNVCEYAFNRSLPFIRALRLPVPLKLPSFMRAKPAPLYVTPGQPAKAVIILFLTLYLWGTVSYLTPRIRLPWVVYRVAEGFEFIQPWKMFERGSPDGWCVVSGTLKDGTKVDLLDEGRHPPDRNKRPRDYAVYRRPRDQKYMFQLIYGNTPGLIPYYEWYQCRMWNKHLNGRSPLVNVEMDFVRKTPPMNEAPSAILQTPLANYQCPNS